MPRTLTLEELGAYWEQGHVMIPDVFPEELMDEAIVEAMAWSEEALPTLEGKERLWCLEGSLPGRQVPRKLENPVHFHPAFKALACSSFVLPVVKQVLGPDLMVRFSQIFFKAPHTGTKPMHQDNFYIRPVGDREDYGDSLVSVWIAFEESTPENGCLVYASGSHKGEILAHSAPPGEPYHDQVAGRDIEHFAIRTVPVPKGGISLHHGRVVHGSRANRTDGWRRALSVSFVAVDTVD